MTTPDLPQDRVNPDLSFEEQQRENRKRVRWNAGFGNFCRFHEARQSLLRMKDPDYQKHIQNLRKLRRKWPVHSAAKRMGFATSLAHKFLENGSPELSGGNGVIDYTDFKFVVDGLTAFSIVDDSFSKSMEDSNIEECSRIVELFLDPGPSHPDGLEDLERTWELQREDILRSWNDRDRHEEFYEMIDRWNKFGRIASALHVDTFEQIIEDLVKATNLLSQAKGDLDNYEETD